MTCYSLLGHTLFGHSQFLHQWTLTTPVRVSYHSKGPAECLSFSCSFILFLSPFHYSLVSGSETFSAATVSSSLTIPSSCCGHCYRCHTHSLGLLFSRCWITFVHLCFLVRFILYCRSFDSCSFAVLNGL